MKVRPGIPSCATKPVAIYAAAVRQSHSPAASAGACLRLIGSPAPPPFISCQHSSISIEQYLTDCTSKAHLKHHPTVFIGDFSMTPFLQAALLQVFW